MTKIRFSQEAKEIYDILGNLASTSKKERMIFLSLKQKLEHIEKNPHYGEPISKKIIPEVYKIKYGITNLFRIELPQFWRMLYTLTSEDDEVEIIAFILDVVDHKKYDKRFGYFKKK